MVDESDRQRNQVMAYSFYIDTAIDCVFIQHFGDYEIGEGICSVEAFVREPSYHNNMNILRDFRQTTLPSNFGESPIVIESQKRMKDNDELLAGACQIALVVGSAKDYGIMHRYTVSYRLGTLAERRPFRDIAKARNWLEIPDGYEIKISTSD